MVDALNVVYQKVVNDRDFDRAEDAKYLEAKTFIEIYFPRLNDSVLECLLVYMNAYKDGKIEFSQSENSLVDLICDYNSLKRIIGFEESGRIAYDTIEQENGFEGQQINK